MHLLPRLGSRSISPSRRPKTRLRLQALEDRSLPSFGFGSAFSFGGAGDDRGNAIVLDAAGSTYVSGFYNSTVDFDPNHTSSASILTATGVNGDGFVAKYLANGTFQWATDLGPGVAAELAVQGSNVYVPYSGTGGYVSRLDASTGAITWTTTFTANSDGAADAVAVGPSGNVYADGRSHNDSSSQAIVEQIDPSGNVLWSRTSTGGGGTNAIRLAVDSAGNAYAAGFYTGTATFGSTALTSYSGASDAFVWKLNASGGSVWAGSMGSTGGTTPWGITTDGSGNAYVTGYWAGGSNNFNPGSGRAVSLTYQGGIDDIFIAKLTPGKNGAMQLGWAKDIGGSGFDIGYAVAVDGSGNVYTAGGFSGTVNFNPNGGTAHNLSGGGIFVSKLDANGNYVAAAGMANSPAGTGNGKGAARGIALDGGGNVYTTGYFGGTSDFDPTSGTYNLTSNGSQDIFVSKLTQTLTPGAMAPGGQAPDVSMPNVPAANGSFSPTAPAVALPATTDPAAPDQIDWLAAAAARKRSSLFADWLADGQ
jgi:hypothetical protein